MKSLLLILSLFLLCSCGSLYREDKKIESTNKATLKGSVASFPIDLILDNTNSSKSITEVKSPAIEQGTSIIGYIISLVAGGGVGAIAIRSALGGTISRLVGSIEKYKENASTANVEALHKVLGSNLTESDKVLVKKHKDKRKKLNV